MPHRYEAQVIRELEDWNLQAAESFKSCINIAKTWKSHRNLQSGSDDAFSNVMNNSGCNANLTQWLSHDPNLLQRAQICLNYYR